MDPQQDQISAVFYTLRPSKEDALNHTQNYINNINCKYSFKSPIANLLKNQHYLKCVWQISQIKCVVKFDDCRQKGVNHLLMKCNGSLDHCCSTPLNQHTEGLLHQVATQDLTEDGHLRLRWREVYRKHWKMSLKKDKETTKQCIIVIDGKIHIKGKYYWCCFGLTFYLPACWNAFLAGTLV